MLENKETLSEEMTVDERGKVIIPCEKVCGQEVPDLKSEDEQCPHGHTEKRYKSDCIICMANLKKEYGVRDGK